VFNTIVVYAIYLALLLVCGFWLGLYMAKVYNNESTMVDKLFNPVARLFYKLSGVDPSVEMTWWDYTKALLWFNVLGFAAELVLLLAQQLLPLNPAGIPNMNFWTAFNTAVSFMTNTNWQSYGGETSASYLSQMLALTVQNFLSAATGLAVAVALIRGLLRRTTKYIGNFWSDMTRSVLWILLPLSIIVALLFVSQGVIQNFSSYQQVTTLEGAQQTIAMGPVASQEAIKLIGTNGGGFFNTNSAHPFENPTPFSNYLSIFSIMLIPAAVVFAFGKMAKDMGQGKSIIIAMTILFVIGLAVVCYSETAGNPLLAKLNIAQPTAMEGKEVRFGIADTALFATATTDVSCGAVNSMHDSYMPLGGMMLILNMMFGEVVFGGVGAGFYGMILFVLLTVFIIGLMVGRTPEYLGKKIEVPEMKLAMVGILVPGIGILFSSALAVALPAGLAGIGNPGPHGLSEVLYAFSSTVGNNGSAFAGLNAALPFYNILTAICMLFGRFAIIIPVLAIAGNMAQKKHTPANSGTFHTDGVLFAVLLAGSVLIVGALTFVPALALGPILEQLLLTIG
jgi:K+-transporting ATPase ATPase A chain